jgi:signal peptidase I
MLKLLVDILALLLVPVGAYALIDDWFLRPHRRLKSHPAQPAESPLVRLVYGVLPVLVCAGVVRLVLAERMDFSLVLVLVVFVSGIVYGIDVVLFRRHRVGAAQAAGKPAMAAPEPGIVDYARSFFPVALAVLVLRSFLFEPFRIPSDSMMPTLFAGDFILVNKYAYGLRLPVSNQLLVEVGKPERGDVVVFRYPPDPAINYIKRLVGLPGDRVRVVGDRVYVNGELAAWQEVGIWSDGCYQDMQLARETLGTHEHEVMHCVSESGIFSAPLPSCNRRNLERGYLCRQGGSDLTDTGNMGEIVVPEGQYFMVGDNRDNSADSRYFGFVPEANLVGKAQRIWFNWDLQRTGGPLWSRIGRRID